MPVCHLEIFEEIILQNTKTVFLINYQESEKIISLFTETENFSSLIGYKSLFKILKQTPLGFEIV